MTKFYFQVKFKWYLSYDSPYK